MSQKDSPALLTGAGLFLMGLWGGGLSDYITIPLAQEPSLSWFCHPGRSRLLANVSLSMTGFAVFTCRETGPISISKICTTWFDAWKPGYKQWGTEEKTETDTYTEQLGSDGLLPLMEWHHLPHSPDPQGCIYYEQHRGRSYLVW